MAMILGYADPDHAHQLLEHARWLRGVAREPGPFGDLLRGAHRGPTERPPFANDPEPRPDAEREQGR